MTEQVHEENLFSGLTISFAIHSLFVSLLILKSVFWKEGKIDYTAPIRVDLVGLPDKVVENLPAPDAPPVQEIKKENLESATPQQKESPPADFVFKEAKDHKKNRDILSDAIRRLKTKSAIDKLKEDRAKSHIDKLAQNSLKDTPLTESRPIKGNVISPGSAIEGLINADRKNYTVLLDQHIKRYWALPEWLMDRGLRCQVQVFIGPDGSLVSRRLLVSSNNAEFDAAAISTIEQAAPFPKIPSTIAEELAKRGAIVFFPN